MSDELGCLIVAIPAVIIGVVSMVIVVVKRVNNKERLDALTPEDRDEESNAALYGPKNPAMICPHCQTIHQVFDPCLPKAMLNP